jgi:hypothetical protein
MFENERCYELHKGTICAIYHKCNNCEREYNVKEEKIHICGVKLCQKCFTRHGYDEYCFIRKLKIPKDLPVYRIVSYDLECTVG